MSRLPTLFKSSATGTPDVELYVMARDIRVAMDEAALITPRGQGVLPVGEAWTRAMEAGVADPNPYDGIAPDQVDLWTTDHYHASSYATIWRRWLSSGPLPDSIHGRLATENVPVWSWGSRDLRSRRYSRSPSISSRAHMV